MGALILMVKMPWLKSRLRDVGRTPAGLARHLKIQGPRVYEMIAGRRGMQPDEIAPTAEYLNWTVDVLLAKLPREARVLPHNVSIVHSVGAGMIPVLATARPKDAGKWDLLLTGETARYVEPLPALKGRNDIQCLYMGTSVMEPWRDPGELIMFEKERPPKERDYVVVYLVGDDNETRVVVRQLLRDTASKLSLRQHNPRRDTTIDRKTVASMFRVMTWDDCVR